jgi:hypothetical protein
MKQKSLKLNRATRTSSLKRGQALLEYVLLLGLVSIITSLIVNFFVIEVWNVSLGPGNGALYTRLIQNMTMP